MGKILDGDGHKRIVEFTESVVDGAPTVEVVTYEGNMILSRVRFVIWNGDLSLVKRHVRSLIEDWGL